MENLEVNEKKHQRVPKPREIATPDSNNRAATMKEIREIFSEDKKLYEYFGSVGVYPDKDNPFGFTIQMQHATVIRIQLPPVRTSTLGPTALPTRLIIQSIGNKNYNRTIGMLKPITLEDLPEYVKLFAHLDRIGGISDAKQKGLKFVPRTFTIEDTDGTVYTKLDNLPFTVKEIFEIVEIFFHITSKTNPPPRKYQGEKI